MSAKNGKQIGLEHLATLDGYLSMGGHTLRSAWRFVEVAAILRRYASCAIARCRFGSGPGPLSVRSSRAVPHSWRATGCHEAAPWMSPCSWRRNRRVP